MLAAASRDSPRPSSSSGRLCSVMRRSVMRRCMMRRCMMRPSMMRRHTGSARLTCEHCCARHRGATVLPRQHGPRARRQGNGDALDDVRAGFTEEEGEELLVRRLHVLADGRSSRGRGAAPRRRFTRSLSVHKRRSERRVPAPYHFQHTTYRGACGKARVVP